MTTLPLDKIEQANGSASIYHLTMTLTPGDLSLDGEVDEMKDASHLQLGVGRVTREEWAEAIRIGSEAYGRRPANSGRWRALAAHKPTLQYRRSALELLKRAPAIVTEDRMESVWVAEIRDIDLPAKREPEAFFDSILPKDLPERPAMLRHMAQSVEHIEVTTRLWIGQSDYLIRRMVVEARSSNSSTGLTSMNVVFGLSHANIQLPEPNEILTAATPLPEAALLFTLPWGGWSQWNHALWAQSSIDLIKTRDPLDNRDATGQPAPRYAEIYDPIWSTASFPQPDGNAPRLIPADAAHTATHHPIVCGAHYEDAELMDLEQYDRFFDSDPQDTGYYYPRAAFQRDYNHYGGEDAGVQYHWYFDYRNGLTGPDAPPRPYHDEDRYYSARDWGYGGIRLLPDDPNANHLTFTEAIKQYNRSTFDGKRAAYLMLGHVLHLLQDQGMPDHAALVAHPGSAKTARELYFDLNVALVMAGEIAAAAGVACGLWPLGPLCAAAAFEATWAYYMATKTDDIMGYERLVQDYWVGLDAIVANLQDPQSKPLPESKEYDVSFKDLASAAISISVDRRRSAEWLAWPLGCNTCPVVPGGIPGLEPDIDSTNATTTEPYLALTDALVEKILIEGTGLIRYFYEIVNPPPFVERVTILQAADALHPSAFGCLDGCPSAPVRYSARWEPQEAGGRKLKFEELPGQSPAPLIPGHRAYIFIVFGPSVPRPDGQIDTKRMDPASLTVTFAGHPELALDGPLTSATDPAVGTYYWGSFVVPDSSPDSTQGYEMTLQIAGADISAHLNRRVEGGYGTGAGLAPNPATPAIIDVESAPLYPFIGYGSEGETGVDRNHHLLVAPSVVSAVTSPNNSLDTAYPLDFVGAPPATLLKPTYLPTVQSRLIGDTDADFYRVTWQTGTVEVAGFGEVQFVADDLFIRINELELGSMMTLTACDSQGTPYFGHTKSGAHIADMVPVGDTQTAFLKVTNPAPACQGNVAYGIQVGLGTYVPKLHPVAEVIDILHRLPHEDLRVWRGDIVEYHDTSLLIADLSRSVDELVATRRTLTELERRRESARLRAAVGALAQRLRLSGTPGEGGWG